MEEIHLTQQEQDLLKECSQVWQMAESEGFKLRLRPWLEVKLNQAFPRPLDFKKEEEFVYAAKVTSVFKEVIAEILGWVDGSIEQAKKLEKKKKGEIVDLFQIGKE